MTAVVHSDSNDEEETNTMSAEQDGVPLEQTGQSDENTMVTQVSLPTDDVAKKNASSQVSLNKFYFQGFNGASYILYIKQGYTRRSQEDVEDIVMSN